MTPKEKANELIENYRNAYPTYTSNRLNIHQAKRCALIAVDEILNLDLHNVGDYKDFDTPSEWYISYWMEIKEEIEKL